MPGTPLIERSIGMSADSTSTCALAPGNDIVTETTGGAIDGNCEMGLLRIASTPTNAMTIEITIARTGR
jgi:hypothetical protein